MLATVTDKRFLIGVAVGWLVIPYALKFVGGNLPIKAGAPGKTTS